MKILAICFFILALSSCSSAPKNPWAEVTTPTPGPPRPIGRYSAGCITGALQIPLEGPGYRIAHLERRRFYGHPEIIDFLESMGKAVEEQHYPPLRIGDIGMARGGPMPTGHASHQIGLDADVWFAEDGRSMLTAGGNTIDHSRWSDMQEWILKKAVSDDQVDRIFVNPVIKRDFCARDPYAPWLAKLRPWWGHDDHWHVRMKCPAGDSDCVPTDPIPPGNGCDATLDWWFSDEAKKKGAETPARRELPKLPDACAQVLSDSINSAP